MRFHGGHSSRTADPHTFFAHVRRRYLRGYAELSWTLIPPEIAQLDELRALCAHHISSQCLFFSLDIGQSCHLCKDCTKSEGQ